MRSVSFVDLVRNTAMSHHGSCFVWYSQRMEVFIDVFDRTSYRNIERLEVRLYCRKRHANQQGEGSIWLALLTRQAQNQYLNDQVKYNFRHLYSTSDYSILH